MTVQDSNQLVLAATVRPEKCAVCGMRAFGYNYEVISCNACKMFFRRTVIEKAEYLCKNNRECFDGDLNDNKRPKCRFCRFKKCLTVGMRPRLSESDENFIATPSVALNSQIVSSDKITMNIIDKLHFLHKTRQYVYSQMDCTDDPSFCDLVATDISCLSKLGVSTNVAWEKTKYLIKPWGSLGIRVVAEIIKEMDFYKKLLLSDRVILLKSVSLKSHSLSVSFDSYNRKSERVLTPSDGEVFPAALRSLPGCGEIIDTLSTRLIRPMIENSITETEFLLLNMIVICNPAIPGLSPSGQQVIAGEQQLFCRLLLQQCFLADSRNGASRLAAILNLNQLLDGHLQFGRMLDTKLRKDLKIHFFMPQLLLDACDIKAEKLHM